MMYLGIVQVAIIFIPFTSHRVQFAIVQLMKPQPDCPIKFLFLVLNEKSKQCTGIIPLEQVSLISFSSLHEDVRYFVPCILKLLFAK